MPIPALLLIALPPLASSDALATVTLAHAAEASAARWSPAELPPQQHEIVRLEDGRPVLLRLTEYQ